MTEEKGNKISVGNIGRDLSGNVVGRDLNRQETYTEGDNISVTNSTNVSIKSTLTNVTQTVGTLPDSEAKQELTHLLNQLEATLQQVPAEQAQEAEAVAGQASTLVEQATSEKPNPVSIKITAEGLKTAAKNIALVIPAVVDISGKIIGAVMKLPGVS